MSTTKKSERYTTILGEVIEYPTPSADVAAFVARATRAAHDPAVTETQLTELVYGRDNPILDQTIFPGRGAVTKAVMANPVYHVLLDLLDAKRIQTRALDPGAANAAFSMTVAEAAAELGISESAVRQAIAAKHLASTKRGNVHLIDPQSIATYRERVVRRGPTPKESATPEQSSPALRVRMGNSPGESLMFKAIGPNSRITTTRVAPRIVEGSVPSFTRAAIKFGGKTGQRMFVLEPSDDENEFALGQFFIRGRYRVAEKINNSAEAAERWLTFARDRHPEDRVGSIVESEGGGVVVRNMKVHE